MKAMRVDTRARARRARDERRGRGLSAFVFAAFVFAGGADAKSMNDHDFVGRQGRDGGGWWVQYDWNNGGNVNYVRKYSLGSKDNQMSCAKVNHNGVEACLLKNDNDYPRWGMGPGYVSNFDHANRRVMRFKESESSRTLGGYDDDARSPENDVDRVWLVARAQCPGYWTSWSTCSETCEVGKQTRTYVIPTNAKSRCGFACDYNDDGTSGYKGCYDCETRRQTQDRECDPGCPAPTVSVTPSTNKVTTSQLIYTVSMSHSTDLSRVQCDVTARMTSVSCSTYGSHFPCKRINSGDFKDTESVSLNTAEGETRIGKYVLEYDCSVVKGAYEKAGHATGSFEFDVVKGDAPLVTMSNRQTIVTTSTIDFGFSVNHDYLCEGECYGQSSAPMAHWVKCDTVARRQGDDCGGNFGANLPCKRWDNFPDELALNDANGNTPAGDYIIEYDCYAFKPAGEQTLSSTPTNTVLSDRTTGSFEFKIVKGCDEIMPIGSESSEIAKYILFTSDQFLRASCSSVVLSGVKEAIFRELDNDPADGILEYEEILAAAKRHQVDSYIVKQWNDRVESMKISLGEFLTAKATPPRCEQPADSVALFEHVTYPTSESGRDTSVVDCEAGASTMRVEWTFTETSRATPQHGDTICAYVDGILFQESQVSNHNSASYEEVSPGVYALAKIVDKRPVFGGFADVQPSLAAQFTFDGELLGGVAASHAGANAGQTAVPTISGVAPHVVVACPDGNGGMCAHPTSGGFTYAGDVFEGGIAFSTWFQCQMSLTGTVKLIESSGSGSRFFVERDCTETRWGLTATFGSRSVRLESLAETFSDWHLVGFTLNQFGLFLFDYTLDNPTVRTFSEDGWRSDSLSQLTGIKLLSSPSVKSPDPLMFAVASSGGNELARVQVDSDGNINWNAGSNPRDWLSLSGIRFAVAGRQSLPLLSGWTNWGNSATWAHAEYSCANGFVSVSGLVKRSLSWSSSTNIARLPQGCRPKYRLIFAVLIDGAAQVRVDVHTNGYIEIKPDAGGAASGWLSLSNIGFSIDEGNKQSLTLESNWKQHSSAFGPTQVSCSDTLVSVNGLVKDGTGSKITRLPVGCRPANKLIFALRDWRGGARGRRVDVHPDGSVVLRGTPAGASSGNWVSLSGIVFSTVSPLSTGSLLPSSNGWKSFSGSDGEWGPPAVVRVHDLVVVQGVVRCVGCSNTGLTNSLGKVTYVERHLIDDVRLYSGNVDQETFSSAHSCGRATLCADRARTAPASRRFACVQKKQPHNTESEREFACAGGMFYDGAAIDVRISIEMVGVLFSFRDTAWSENAFEIERKRAGAGFENDEFETIILVDSDLKGCAARFNSITYVDRDAALEPGAEWQYRISTKLRSDGSSSANESSAPIALVSSSVTFKAPWMATIEGMVITGAAATPVRNTRVCAEFETYMKAGGRSSYTFSSSNSTTADGGRNLAAFKRVYHSSEAIADAYLATDGRLDTGDVLIARGDYVRVDLGAWMSIETIRVCHSPGDASTHAQPPPFRAYVQDHDPRGSENHGYACQWDASATASGWDCADFACFGTNVTSFHGQYVTVEATSNAHATEISVFGSLTACAYTAITDDEGQFELQIIDSHDVVPVKALIHIGAYKEEIFPETSETVFDSSSANPQHVLLVLVASIESNRPQNLESGGVVKFWKHKNFDSSSYHVSVTDVVYGEKYELSSDVTRKVQSMKINPGYEIVMHPSSETDTRVWGAGAGEYGFLRLRDGVMAQMRFKTSAGDAEQRIPSTDHHHGSNPNKEFKYFAVFPETKCPGYWQRTDDDVALTFVIPSDAKSRGGFECEYGDDGAPGYTGCVQCAYARGETRNAFARFANADVDETETIEPSELVAWIERESVYGVSSHAIVTDDVWNAYDIDGDGLLNTTEFSTLSTHMESNSLSLSPVVVYSPLDVQYMYDFETHRNDTGAVSCNQLVFKHSTTRSLPTNSTDWHSFYATLYNASDAKTLNDVSLECSATRTVEIGVVDAGLYVVPIAVPVQSNNNATHLWVDARVEAKKRLPDIIHAFDRLPASASNTTSTPEAGAGARLGRSRRARLGSTESAETIVTSDEEVSTALSTAALQDAMTMTVKHRAIAEKDIEDLTSIVVYGAILFDAALVEKSYDCGLSGATITVKETQNPDDTKTYTTDESGRFEIPVTMGTTYTFEASYGDHNICYAGTTLESPCAANVAKTELTITEQHSNYIFFKDITARTMSAFGVTHGACDRQYSDTTFTITPVSGCHAPVFVDAATIAQDWTHSDEIGWPYAAMDYSISLYSGPSVAGVWEKIEDEPYADGCATEPGDMLAFFRKRNALERVAAFKDNDDVEIKYQYHGYVCVRIIDGGSDADVPVIDDPDALCITADGLQSIHVFGASQFTQQCDRLTTTVTKNIVVEVFELHHDATNELQQCHIVPGSTTTTPPTESAAGSTMVSFRETITPDGDCHPNRGGGEDCTFQVQPDTSNPNYIVWPGSLSHYVLTATEPNLAGVHRRYVDVTVDRSDTYFTVTAHANREFVPLGSKTRNGDGYGSSDFWATVPVEGLVYTVVHDPPGDNSYAELATGSTVGLEMHITGARMASSAHESAWQNYHNPEIKSEGGVVVGVGAAVAFTHQTEWLEGEYKLKTETKGPEVKMQSSDNSGWHLTMTTDRIVRSSQDEALPGRSGDVILGGGIELEYTLTDEIGLSASCCLVANVTVSWKTRNPTSYVFSVATIEGFVVPNLQALLGVVRSGGVEDGDSGVASCADPACVMTSWESYIIKKLEAWGNTLSWASPTDGSHVVAMNHADSPHGEMFNSAVNGFDNALLTPMKDIMQELTDTWDASMLIMPYNGIGPPPLFDDGKILFGTNWRLDSRFWESEKYPRDNAFKNQEGRVEGDVVSDAMGDLIRFTWLNEAQDTEIHPESDIVRWQDGDVTTSKSGEEAVFKYWFGPEAPQPEPNSPTTNSPTTNSLATNSPTTKWTRAQTQKAAKGVSENLSKFFSGPFLARHKYYKSMAKKFQKELTEATEAANVAKEKYEDHKGTQSRSTDTDTEPRYDADGEKVSKGAYGYTSPDDARKAKQLMERSKSLLKKQDDISDKMGEWHDELDPKRKASLDADKELEECQRSNCGQLEEKKTSAINAKKAVLHQDKLNLTKKLSGAKKYVMAFGLAANLVMFLKDAFTIGAEGHYVSYPRRVYREFYDPTFDERFDNTDPLSVDRFDVTILDDSALFGSGLSSSTLESLWTSFSYCDRQQPDEGCATLKGDGSSLKKGSMLTFGEHSTLAEGEEDFFGATDAQHRVVASFTGAHGKKGFNDDNEAQMLLTFSGGGHNVDYTYEIEESSSDREYTLHVSLNAEASNEYEIELGGLLGNLMNFGMMIAGIDNDGKDVFKKEMSYDRTFVWNYHGQLSVLYSLGDSDFRDKFVVQVGSDSRFGTPVFVTKGGRSACPGEDGTVFRESGWKLEVSATNNRNLDPGERALLTVVVTNDSPYRESTPLGLRLIDGVAQAVYDIIDVANAALYAADADTSSVREAIIDACDESSASDSAVVRSISAAVNNADVSTALPADVVTAAVNAARLAPALGSEISDMKISVNDIKMSPFGEMIPLLPSGSFAAPLSSQRTSPQATFTLAVQPLGETPSAIDGLGLQLLSACEWDLSSYQLNRNPIAHTVSLGDISWSRRCPEVRFDETTVARHAFSKVSTTEPGPLELTVYNPNRALLWPDADLSDPSLMSDTLKKTVVQYRPITGGEWITAKDEASTEDSYKFNYISRNTTDNSIACTSSRTEGCLFQWDVNNAYDKLLSGFKDGVYEVRVKNFCFGGNALADTSVHEYVSDQILNLVVDTVPPETKSFHHDDLARSVWIEYFESVDCSNSALNLTRTYLDATCSTVNEYVSREDIEFEFKVVCYDTAWLLKFPSYLNGTVTGTLTGIQDLSGLVADDYTFVFSTGNMTVDGCGAASNAAAAAAAAALSAIEVKRVPSALGEEHFRGFATAAPFVSATMSATIFLVGALALSAFFAIRARSSTSPILTRAQRVGERSALRIEDARRESLGYGAVV